MNSVAVFCGGSPGVRPAYADAARAVGRELAAQGLTIIYGGGHIGLMGALADAFIALPGGYGTLDELFEMLTWTQIGTQAKPCGVLNVAGYYDTLLAWVGHAVREGLVRPGHKDLLLAAPDVDTLLEALASWTFREIPLS